MSTDANKLAAGLDFSHLIGGLNASQIKDEISRLGEVLAARRQELAAAADDDRKTFIEKVIAFRDAKLAAFTRALAKTREFVSGDLDAKCAALENENENLRAQLAALSLPASPSAATETPAAASTGAAAVSGGDGGPALPALEGDAKARARR